MRRSQRRLLGLAIGVPATVCALAALYSAGMSYLEGEPRTFWQSLEWAAETVTSTGYGADAQWRHPAMIAFVVLVQFAGVLLVFLVVPLVLIPFIEERFEGRLATALPRLSDHVVIYGYGAAVSGLVDTLIESRIPLLVLEEDAARARRMLDRGIDVVHVSIEDDVPDLSGLPAARALVLNGPDHNNAVLALAAREAGFDGPIVALVESPQRRNPMRLAGATAAFTPPHVLAAAIAAKASPLINPRVAGAHSLGKHLDIAELRVHDDSPLAGATLAQARIRERTGATIIGQWVGGELSQQPAPDAPIPPGTILVAAGSRDSLARLADITRPMTRHGHLIVAGGGTVGSKVAQFLSDAGETVRVIDDRERPGVDVVGEPLDPETLRRAGIGSARAVILALENDAATLFAAAVVRDLAPEVAIVASVDRAANVARIHRAGADFSLSIAQVTGQLLMHHVLGEQSIALEPRLKVVKLAPGELVGTNPASARVRQRTGCSIVAVERGDDVIVELDGAFAFEPADAVYVCGTTDALARYFDEFPGARATG
ncbi:MAG: hypothetical protein D6689_12225 [Deltaproteobacteria bacterium]|nr:MAG: hypothetical protein D6689_12225 [Deltaproteobacteria bacterium]